MSRPPGGASFAQFFPSAPRAAKDRATERERAKTRVQESPSSSSQPAANTNGYPSPIAPSGSRPTDDASASGLASRPSRDASASDASHPPPQPDDNESLSGDILNAVGSASSTSTSDSVFSGSTRQNAMATYKNSNHLTPLTTTDSPSPANHTMPQPAKTHATAPRPADKTDGSAPKPDGYADENPPPPPGAIDRVPARDPNRSVKAIKCVHKPILDRSGSSSGKSKPTFQEFGMVRTCIIYCSPLRGERHLCCESFG